MYAGKSAQDILLLVSGTKTHKTFNASVTMQTRESRSLPHWKGVSQRIFLGKDVLELVRHSAPEMQEQGPSPSCLLLNGSGHVDGKIPAHPVVFYLKSVNLEDEAESMSV